MTLHMGSDEIAAWWRRPGEVTAGLWVSGDLPMAADAAEAHLADWVAVGVTDILDVREEWSDEDLVAELAPEIAYHHLGVDDDGSERDLGWFDAGVAIAREALGQTSPGMMVHCHMGINRGPSMAYAILLDQGWDAVEALDAIRTARPIAAIAYAEDALVWHHARRRSDTDELVEDLARVDGWHAVNGIDVVTVIRRIRVAEADEG